MDADSESYRLKTIYQHVQNTKLTQNERMEIDDSQSAAIEARLEQTLKTLQDRVGEQRTALEQLRESSARPAPRGPSADPRVHLQQLRTIKTAYDSLTHSKPNLPPTGSPIPALLATRVTERKITGTREAISESQSRLEHVRQRLKQEEQNLQDNNLITEKLQERIARLSQEKDEQLQRSPADIANEQVRIKQARKAHYEQAIEQQRQALDHFIDSHLAAMIAAEELGGPTIGDVLDISTEMLENGFSAQGKPKPASKAAVSKNKKGQMRLDRHGNLIRGSGEDESMGEKEIAAANTKQLLDELFNALLGQDASGGYVTLQRDSAAARFLVRAKVAQFHPKDARRLRLVDFGRELDD